jgi:WD40 repeat protein/serine/threonine protein kinase
MNSEGAMSDASAGARDREQLLDEVVFAYLQAAEGGGVPDRRAWLERYPELAAELTAFFADQDRFDGVAAPLRRVAEAAVVGGRAVAEPGQAGAGGDSAVDSGGRIGDYRILREIGRGGMGVVYEAEQESLGRRVALKVLHLHAGQDPRLLERFRRESRAAAQLHHTNIVPVHEVGQQGDLCYYAMQFIRGQALDEVFRELCRLRQIGAPHAGRAGAAVVNPQIHSLSTVPVGQAGVANDRADHEPAPVLVAPRPAETTTVALPDHSELSSVTSNFRRYCRNVTRLGLQAAEALAYAHGRGIVHRDIKPANLLLDSTGVLWVSDFGLVKTQDPALTDTGDLVGTLRYMAPERFRGECDARADVYALGLTLYELLVLRPAFDGQDRMHLVDQIGHQEPARPRVLDPRIPRDLETILMKAIEKEPRRRYPSAEALAGDLRRFLADEPIQARRIGPLERLGRWGRRNPLVAGLSAAVVLVAALGFVGVFGQMQVAQANEQQAKQERDDARALAEQLKVALEQLRRTTYTAQINLAQHAWEAGATDQVEELLEQQRPKPGETDLRHFEWQYLYRLSHTDLLRLNAGHTYSVVYSPDGKRLASAGGSVKLWDAQTGKELLSLKQGFAGCVAFSPDAKRLATTNFETAKVWDAQTGQELLTIKGAGRGVAFSPDGKRLASSSGGGVKVWDAQTGEELLALKGQNRDYLVSFRVVFSPDGKRLASPEDKTVKVWDAQTGQELLPLTGHTHRVTGVAFSPDGKRLACASQGGTVKVWDVQTGQELLSFKGSAIYIAGIAFSPDGKRLASASGDRMVRVWDAQTGQELFTFKGHASNVWDVAFSPDGKRLASGAVDGTVRVWDAQTGQKPLTLPGAATSSVAGVAFSPDGKRIASGGRGQPGARPGALMVWDAQTGQEILALQGHTAKVTTVAYSPDGKRLASGAEDKTVKIWDAQTGQELHTLKGHTKEILSVAFSPDGKRLASTGNEMKVWDAQTGQEILTLKGVGWNMVFSPDGKRLASRSGREVNVWDAQTGQEILSLKEQSVFGYDAAGVAFSPDGKRLASAGDRGMPGVVKVWDAQTGKELQTLKGHTNFVWGVVFSPDGQRVASGAEDKTVKVWDAQTGQELLTIKGLEARVHGLAFSPDGQRLASVAQNGTVTIWDATPLPAKP